MLNLISLILLSKDVIQWRELYNIGHFIQNIAECAKSPIMAIYFEDIDTK